MRCAGGSTDGAPTTDRPGRLPAWRPIVEAERKLAAWLKAESTLIYPSVTLANHGILPALVTRHDALVVDKNAHHSVQEGMKLVRACGAKTETFAHDDVTDLERVLNG